MQEISAGVRQVIPSVGGEEYCDLEKLIPIDMIRIHTKTDDVPSVTDDQLAMYRDAAVEAAEQYTGMLLATTKSVVEPVDCPMSVRVMRQMSFIHRTQYPVSEPIAYMYGQGMNQTIPVKKGSREIKIPIVIMSPDLSSSCCRSPCSPINECNTGMQLMYRAGFDLNAPAKQGGIPQGVILGCLKYIAWNITHPGDEMYTARNRISNNQAGLLLGTNNIAWASGALELWRQYDPDAI
jgi:hypothetical protein